VIEEAIPSTEIPAKEIGRYLSAAEQFADEARRIAEPWVAQGFSVEVKKDASYVTEVDRAIEAKLRELVSRWFPSHGVIGEEYPACQPQSAFQWIVDPIDGTEELIHGIPTWGTFIALHYQGVPIVGLIDHPAPGIRVSAGRGVGTWRNGRQVSPETSGAPRAREAIRFVMTARLNFTRGIDEGRLFDDLARRFPNHRIYRGSRRLLCRSARLQHAGRPLADRGVRQERRRG
jgi:fructose-1,6-bisphosphatase/inositol monophosphatase family enzyme